MNQTNTIVNGCQQNGKKHTAARTDQILTKEIIQKVSELFRFVSVYGMATIIKDIYLAARNLFGRDVGIANRDHPVLSPPDQQGRRHE